MAIKSQKKRADGSMLLEIDETFHAGRDLVKKVDIAIVQTKDGWRLEQPRTFLPEGFDRFETEKRAVGVLRQGAKEVAAGLFKNRSESEDVVAIELVSLIAGELLNSPEWKEISELAADAKRLRLIPADGYGLLPEPQPVVVEAAPGAKQGTVRLSIMEISKELAAGEVAKALRERLGAAAGSPAMAVQMLIAPGLPSEDLLKVLHALVDLRLELSHGIALVMREPKELEKVAPQLTGRLRFLTPGQGLSVAASSPPVEAKLDPDTNNSNLDAGVRPLLDNLAPPGAVPGPLAPESAPVALPLPTASIPVASPLAPDSPPVAFPPAPTGEVKLRGPGALSPAPTSTKP
jgi:hypothetical protein